MPKNAERVRQKIILRFVINPNIVLRNNRTGESRAIWNLAERTINFSFAGHSSIMDAMHSWEALDPVPLKAAGAITTAFLGIATDLRTAAQYVCGLPYGRNSDANEPLIVLAERRGTCSTKHALLRRLAIEQGLDVALVLGIYEMTERNTPGIGAVLERYGLTGLLEAHCYLRTENKRIDVTRGTCQIRGEPIESFLHEEEIDPTQITDYKAEVHRKFLNQWIADSCGLGGLSLAQVWKIREECIAQLSQ